MTLRPTFGGPGFFVTKLRDQFAEIGVDVTFRNLRSAQAALLFSVAWGDWFHARCRRWGVRTVLRLDGIYLPSYYDNRPQPETFQDRRLTPSLMAINSRAQRDLSMCDFVVYQSEYSKRMADQFLYRRRDNYAIVFNGVNLDLFRPSPRTGRHRLVSCGTLRDEYMLGTVLPVFRRLWREADLDLLIIGPMDEINRRQLDAFRSTDPQAASRIECVGPVANADLPRHLARGDLFLHPRLGDCCPNAVVEALACGLPVICGSWGGTAELVGDAGAVVAADGWDYGDDYIDRLTEATRGVLNDLDRLRIAARRRAEREFDISIIAQRYLSCLGLDAA